jgi:cellulose synthase/poly-beta-1,6-N-acetylglucosamine synthase-like glycosyltransferase
VVTESFAIIHLFLLFRILYKLWPFFSIFVIINLAPQNP